MIAGADSRRTLPAISLGRGTQASVELDPESMLVRKSFLDSDDGNPAELVNQESQYLSRYSRALAGHPYVSCPEPVRADPAAGTLWMTFCTGQRLDELLVAGHVTQESELDHIAQQIAVGLDVYVDAFDEPYFDLTTANILYDSETGVLSFIDLADPGIYTGYDLHEVRHDLSVGNFISSTTYHTLRPKHMRNLGYWRRQRYLTLEFLRRVTERRVIRKDVIWRVQADKYSAHANHGGVPRRSWFLSVGKLMYLWRLKSITACLES